MQTKPRQGEERERLLVKVLEEMPKANRSGRKPKHDYDAFFSHGENPVELKAGEDFDCSVRTMRHNLYRQSKVRNISIKTVTQDDTSIVFRVLPEAKEETEKKQTPTKKIASKLTAKKKQ